MSDSELIDENPIEGFREGWRDAMMGNIFPASVLWDDLDDEEDPSADE